MPHRGTDEGSSGMTLAYCYALTVTLSITYQKFLRSLISVGSLLGNQNLYGVLPQAQIFMQNVMEN